jgi:hypothetical protein
MLPESKVFVETWSPSPVNEGRVFAAVFAHSDDLAIFAGGTAMKLISEGYKGYFIKTTNDEMDSYDLPFAETIFRIAKETQEHTINFIFDSDVVFNGNISILFNQCEKKIKDTTSTYIFGSIEHKRIIDNILFFMCILTPNHVNQ